MQKITPHLWFNNQAREAAGFYTSLIPNSRIKHVTTLHNTPSGDCDLVSFELSGQPFMAISAGPLFTFNPSVSFHVKCGTKDEVDATWARLSEGGRRVLVPLGAYPFSERYGWLEDKYGLSWQVILAAQGAGDQGIMPALMFVGPVSGKAEEALNLYTSVFRNSPGDGEAAANSKAVIFARHGKGEEPEREGTVKYASFTLLGQEFAAMDSAREHNFGFNEAISFMVPCDTQEEIDYFWAKLSADPNSGQCGWLKDKYGLSWQITPTIMNEMLAGGDQERIGRVTQAFLKMKKFDIAALKRAYESQ
jgi:predicted 3-demethylubiquinone-9 3-methyltransferase (glyoxalase superfamily)